MKIEKVLYLVVKIDEDDVQAGDLSALVYFVDEISKAIASSEAMDLLDFLNYSSAEKIHIVQNYNKYGEIPARLEDLKKGSAEIIVGISSGLLMWGLTTFLAKPIEAAWESSRGRDALVSYVRDRFFGGAEKATNQRLAEIPRKKKLSVSSVKVSKANNGQIQKISIMLRRAEVEIVDRTDQDLLDEFVRRIS